MPNENTTAISHINKMGGTKHPHFGQIARKFGSGVKIAILNIHVFAAYINSMKTLKDDSESRILPLETERELAKWAFSCVFDKLGMPEKKSQNNWRIRNIDIINCVLVYRRTYIFEEIATFLRFPILLSNTQNFLKNNN